MLMNKAVGGGTVTTTVFFVPAASVRITEPLPEFPVVAATVSVDPLTDTPSKEGMSVLAA
jgi:hypothetical protein